MIIPRGSDVELMVRDTGNHTLSLDLDAIVIKGTRYSVVTYDVTEHGENKDGVGANGRTAKFVGGTALFGTILGAVAGGGKGAGIGALAGGAAGAIGQSATRGSKVHVPAETVLTFQLQQPLNIAPDKGLQQGRTALSSGTAVSCPGSSNRFAHGSASRLRWLRAGSEATGAHPTSVLSFLGSRVRAA